MQHLTSEALARLVDESPTHAERSHLDCCTLCCAELQALRAQTLALADLSPLAAPSRAWPALEARLADEGLVRTTSAVRRSGWTHILLLRAAVYVGLFLLGGASGLAVGRGWSIEAPAGEQNPPGGTSTAAPALVAGTVDDAAHSLRDAEVAYMAALARYSELSGGQAAVDPFARLAALEGIVLTTRAALEDAPADPVINGYHLAAVGQREAMLRQISQTTNDPWF